MLTSPRASPPDLSLPLLEKLAACSWSLTLRTSAWHGGIGEIVLQDIMHAFHKQDIKKALLTVRHIKCTP